MADDIARRLAQAGLGRAQAAVYLALAALGPAGAAEVARQARVPRTTAYGALAALAQAGLASVTYQGRRKRFVAAAPQALLDLPRRQEAALRALLPDLAGIGRRRQLRPRITVHEGLAGIIQVNESLLGAAGSYRYIGSSREMLEAMGRDYLDDYVRRRVERGIHVRAIRVRGRETDLPCLGDGARWLREVRWIDRPVAEGIGTIYLWDGRVAITATAEEPYAMVIESRELAALGDLMFEVLWSTATPAQARTRR